ncbi:hypothetical protein HK097_005535 [Rhizophlyctis rosea]|uniref:Uncharacterized protein n=1 Tax=Rhizophlyctis rosea TaxID=64517 RepID=A0AAD5S1C8_9FUNG|nr:hypothetical protein HK097_005535 [Rhizophlyctis rosea]
MPPKYTIDKTKRAVANQIRDATTKQKDMIKLLSDEYEVIQSNKIAQFYEQYDGDEAAIRTALDEKLAVYREWFRSPKRAGEKRTAVEQEVEGTKKLFKRAKPFKEKVLSDRIAALTATQNQLLTIAAANPTPPTTASSSRANSPDLLDELLNLQSDETGDEDV